MDKTTPLTEESRCGKSEGLRIRELEERVAALERRMNFLLAPGVVYKVTTTPEDLECVRRMDEIGHLIPLPPEPKPATFAEAWQWMLAGGLAECRGFAHKIEGAYSFRRIYPDVWIRESSLGSRCLFGDWKLLPRKDQK